MLLTGSSRTNRTQILAQKYIELVKSGVPSSEILVLLQNNHKKELFKESVKKELTVLENPKIYTFFGLVYNTIKLDWADIESKIPYDGARIIPNLTGLEISQYLFKKCIKNTGFLDYNSKINLLHQLFRRYSLIVQNGLSDKEVEKRSELLGESFAPDAKAAIDRFKYYTLKYRAFDYIRQCAVFNSLKQDSVLLKNVKYLILDDADEITNAQYNFLEHIKPRLCGWFVGMDKHGVSRAGFLCGDFSMPGRIEKLFGNEVKKLDDLPVSAVKVKHICCSKYIEMVKEAFEKAAYLVKREGLKPQDITIAVPETNSAVKFFAAEIFGAKNIKYQIFSGSEKIADDKIIKNILSVLKYVHPALSAKITTTDIRGIFHTLLEIPLKDTLPVVMEFNKKGTVNSENLFEEENYNEKLKIFLQVTEELKNSALPLSSQAEFVIDKLVNTGNSAIIHKINFLIKQIRDFEKVFEEQAADSNFQQSIIIQLENTIVSENPCDSPVVEPDALCIATAQKIIDLNIKSKTALWLDITGMGWTKEDTGTIYNSWVFQPGWSKEDFTFDDNLELTKEKTKRILRKLDLLSSGTIYAYSALFDINGLENTGGIIDFLEFEKEKKETPAAFKFTPREDQKPVLAYKGGKLAISAVPGAGKTTILLALVAKLLKQGVNPENIFVLTYMDSAARNFKERIKNLCPDSDSLPNISTIHGLALRILKENSNYTKIGLNADFEVCDDNERQKILREAIAALGLNHDDYDRYEKAISALKLSGAKKLIQPKFKETKEFLELFKLYNRTLKSRNLVDYDDMLRLAVVLLEKHRDIREHYTKLCRYIIEDEAQDSSKVQQNLLGILSGFYGNLIRCGDINQSITTTFTNADTEGFREFIEKNPCVKMEHSQRCARGIYELANMLATKGNEAFDGKNAFYKTLMKPVEGKNPVSSNCVETGLFEDFNSERSYIVSKIREIYAKDKNASIAILLRSNYQIEEYSNFLANAGFDVVTRTDALERQPAFQLILRLLKFVKSPWDNENVVNFMKTLTEQRLCSLSFTDIAAVENLKQPFISHNPDEFESEALTQLHWDLDYWLESSGLPPEEFATKAGMYYYNSDIEISNVYMISIFIKKLSNLYVQDFTERLETISKKASAGRFKLFDKEENEDDTIERGKIMLMTYHKSKGDEFDYVFIPELSEDMLPFKQENVKIKAQEYFMESIKALNPEYTRKNEHELKMNILEENLRLLYVAITRAKLGLFITCAGKYKKFSRLKDVKPSEFFEMPYISALSENKYAEV